MKAFLLLLVIILISCKKDRTCVCEVSVILYTQAIGSATSLNYTDNHNLKDISKKDAQKQCMEHEEDNYPLNKKYYSECKVK